MFIKSHTNFFNKNLFSLLIIASLAIHAIVIFMSPQATQILNLSSYREDFIREPNESVVTLELENTDTQTENIANSETKKNKKEQKKEKEEKKKHKIFTDTADNAEDEETNVETDKIGEKGSIAKDNFPDDKQPVNNEPHAEGHSKAPLLGKGGSVLPTDAQQQSQEQDATQAVVSHDAFNDKNSPPRYANLSKGLEHQPEPIKPLQTAQAQMLSEESKEKTTAATQVKTDKSTKAENSPQTTKRERLTIGRSIEQEAATEPLSNSEEALFTNKQDEINNDSETKEKPSPSPLQEQEIIKNEAVKVKNPTETKETKETSALKQETPAPPPELSSIEPQRTLERGLDAQESPAELKKPKVAFNVNAKTEGASKDPVLFEDTISNASIPGAPSFHVKKHEYADYFKHIRDRISLYWFLGYGTRAEIKLETKNDHPIIIEFKVFPDGSVDEIKIVDDAGNFQLASRLISSIKNASPLNPFPSKIKEPSIDVRFNFYFF